MLTVGIIGCGNVADAHVRDIKAAGGAVLTSVCDLDETRARDLGRRYNIPRCFQDPGDLLRKNRPDIIHVATPPQSHFSIGKRCLEAGCHVFLEKPFTVLAEEAQELVDLATRKNLKVTVGHDHQFSLVGRRMRELIAAGYLGGRPVHMESYYSYDLSDVIYAKAWISKKDHWVRQLPGNLLQNVISHGISKISEFLSGEDPDVLTCGHTSSVLRSMGGSGCIDELRVLITDGDQTSAFFTFSSQMRPDMHQFRIYGPKNSLISDYSSQTLVKVRGARYCGLLDKLVRPNVLALQYAGGSIANAIRIGRGERDIGGGRRFLLRMFYRSIAGESPVPIPYLEIVRTAKIMDRIFIAIKGRGERQI